MGWRPPGRFLKHRWRGYSEALLLYVLALGATDQAIGPEHYDAFTEGYDWIPVDGEPHLHAAPLFIHLFPQAWLDLRAVGDRPMRERGRTISRTPGAPLRCSATMRAGIQAASPAMANSSGGSVPVTRRAVGCALRTDAGSGFSATSTGARRSGWTTARSCPGRRPPACLSIRTHHARHSVILRQAIPDF